MSSEFEIAQLRRLATAVEQAHDCVLISDTAGVVEYINPAFERLTGYTAQEVIGGTPKILQSGEHDRAFYDELHETLESGAVWYGHFINRKKDGSLYREEATISPVFDEDGAITGYVAVKKDVTRQVALEAELSAAREREAVLRSEKQILDETVSGTVRLLTEMLSMVSPAAFGKAARVARYVDAVCTELQIDDWHLRMAAMLCQVGVLAIPAETFDKARHGSGMDAEEQALFDSHPRIAMRLLSEVPRLERVGAIVGAQATPTGDLEPSIERVGAILRAAVVFDDRLQVGGGRADALECLREPTLQVPRDVARAFQVVKVERGELRPRFSRLADLMPGMRLQQDIVSAGGTLLATRDHELTHTLLNHLRKIVAAHGVQEPIRVLAPVYLSAGPLGTGEL